MATFRKIHTKFWADSFIQELTPEQRYFYLYLITNDKTRQCGIYEITVRQMSFDTGYNVETIEKLLNYFIQNHKIKINRDSNEVAIKNWAKYNDQTSPKVQACINKELLLIKDQSFITYMGYDIPDGVSINDNYRVSDSLRAAVLNKYENKCQKCKSTSNLTIDHIIPRSIGGQSIAENLRCLCRSCNSSRPLLGMELINEIIDSGFEFEYLYRLSTGLNHYKYSIRRQPQEEEEKEREVEKEREKAVEEEKEDFFLRGPVSHQRMLLHDMHDLWKKKFPKYTDDVQNDFPACKSIASFIFRNAGISSGFGDTDAEIKVLNTFQLIADQVSKENFWANKPLKTISNHIQEFYNNIKNPINGTGNKQRRTVIDDDTLKQKLAAKDPRRQQNSC
jgi:5-methylcytosine-specific restriction endonuclease McrA